MRRERIEKLLALQRRWISVDPAETYEEIGVRSFGRGIFHKEPVSGATIGSKRVLRIEPDDLVFNNVFAWEGAVAIAGDTERGKCGSHRFLTYTPRADAITVEYLYYFFLSEPGLRLLGVASPGSAGRNRTLAIERFEALEVPVPSPDEQARICAYLRATTQEVRRLEALAEQTDATPASVLPSVIERILVKHANGSARIGDLVDVVSDLVRPGDDPAPAESFVGLQHIERDTGRRIGEDALGNEKGRKFRFAPGDVVYGYLRPYLNKAWVADRHGLCSVDQYVLRPKEGVSPEYVSFALRSAGTLRSAVELTHSLQLPRLRSGLLRDLEVPQPDPDAMPDVLAELGEAALKQQRASQLLARRKELLTAVRPAALNHAFQFAA